MGRRGLGRRRRIGQQSRRASAVPAASPETISSGRGPGNPANAASMIGSTGSDTTTGRARLSASMKANSSGGQLSVDRNRHDPGLDRAEKRGREVDRVVQAEEDPLLGLNAEPAHEIGKPAHPFGKLGIAIMPAIVDKSCLCAPPGREVALDQIGGGVVRRRDLHPPFSLSGVITSNITP